MTAPRIAASPLARRLAAERGVELSALRGSGPGGRILADDVPGGAPRAASAPAAPTVPEAPPEPTPAPRAAPASYRLSRMVASATLDLFVAEFGRVREVRITDILAEAARRVSPDGAAVTVDPGRAPDAGARGALGLCDMTAAGHVAFDPAPAGALSAVLGVSRPEAGVFRIALVADAAALPPTDGAALIAALADLIEHPAPLFSR
ncbi:E3 binding domain-containing protein [Roseivivax isoporae]|uniref:E3 binding domain-containing protein n=1 Tax=Roseivivax isoporae TaxID=591206 RepID=UPI0004BA33FB